MEWFRKKKSIIITALVVLILNAILIFLGAVSLYDKVQAEKDSLEQEKLKIKNIKEEGRRWQEYSHQKEELMKSEELLENSTINEKNQINLIKKLEELAVQEGVQVDIKAQDAKTDNKSKKKETDDNRIVFDLAFSGQYNEILDYIDKLENLSYILSVEELHIEIPENLSSGKEGDELREEGDLEAEITISFVLKNG